MEYQGKKLRHEIKYFINTQQYWILRNRLKSTLIVDKHGDDMNSYHIRSLYFDDMYQSALLEKESGVKVRSKYRIRIYNISDKVIKLERKNKIDKFINKEDASLTRKQVEQLLRGDVDFLRNTTDPLLKDFYLAYQTKQLRPRVIVDYDREAYTYPLGNVRITFDKDLRAGIDSWDIFDPTVISKKILTDGEMILEVKYDDYLPEHIHHMLQISGHNLSAVSKYVMCTNFIKNIKY